MRVIFKAEKICYSVLMHYTLLSSVKVIQMLKKKNNPEKKKTLFLAFFLVEFHKLDHFPTAEIFNKPYALL